MDGQYLKGVVEEGADNPPHDPLTTPLYTLREVEVILNIGHTTIKRLKTKGQLQTQLICGRIYISEHHLLILKRRTKKGGHLDGDQNRRLPRAQQMYGTILAQIAAHLGVSQKR